MKTMAIIPCRYDSERFPGKPLALIQGKPMIQWVYERVVSIILNVVVATDNLRIHKCVTDFGGRAVLTTNLHQSGTDRVAEAANLLGLEDDDVVVNIQGNQPILDVRSISSAAYVLLNDPSLLMDTLVHRLYDLDEIKDPNVVKCVFDKNHFALLFSRSPIPFCSEWKPYYIFKHLGIYAYRKHFLDTFTRLSVGHLEMIERLEQLRVLDHGYKIKVIETKYDSKSVDVPEDIEKVERVINENIEN